MVTRPAALGMHPAVTAPLERNMLKVVFCALVVVTTATTSARTAKRFRRFMVFLHLLDFLLDFARSSPSGWNPCQPRILAQKSGQCNRLLLALQVLQHAPHPFEPAADYGS